MSHSEKSKAPQMSSFSPFIKIILPKFFDKNHNYVVKFPFTFFISIKAYVNKNLTRIFLLANTLICNYVYLCICTLHGCVYTPGFKISELISVSANDF